MAVEAKRACGYRKTGGLYLVGDYTSVSCDRLPYPLSSCPVCGGGIHFSRSMIKINPLKLFGTHDIQVPVFKDDPTIGGYVTKINCFDLFRPCFICDPTENIAYIFMVGERFYPTPGHFLQEAKMQGISRRIPSNGKPRNLELGKTVIYLAHNNACIVNEPSKQEDANDNNKLLDDSQRHHLGIFSAFIPQRLEKICKQSEYTPDNIEHFKKQNIDLVPVPDNDIDHQPQFKEKDE